MRNCTYVLRVILCLLVFAAGINPGYSQQIEKGITSTTGDYLGFLEFKPKEYATEGNVKHPLIIFLHGIGERGNGTTDLKNVARVGFPQMMRDGWDTKTTWNGKTEKFIVLSPQCPLKYGMWPQQFVNDLINYAKQNLRIDEDRIYLTGLSMGGGGSNVYISNSAQAPKNLAATATICTPCTFWDGTYVADAKMPFWAFHAADDPTALVSCTYRAIDRINEHNPEVKPLKTIWPTGGHIVWDRVYKDTNYVWNNAITIYEWFLGQNRTLPVNKLPVAKATGTTSVTTGTALTQLSGAASTDSDGRIVRYVWKKLSGPAGDVIKNKFSATATTNITNLTTAGTYTYELAVVDDRAAVSRDTISVVVTNGASVPVENVAPVANAGSDITITLPVNKVTVSSALSNDPDGNLEYFLWTKVSGPTSFNIVNKYGSLTEINSLTEGTYVFTLKVTDNKGATNEDNITIKVNPAPTPENVAPVANAGNDITITLPTSKVTVNGSQSADPDGNIVAYLWTKTSGPANYNIVYKNSTSTEINGLTEGTYIFTLKVTDNKGATHEDNVTVKVNPAPPPPPNVSPVSNAGADVTINLPVNKVTVNAGKSSDPDGSIEYFLWTKISGPADYNIVNKYGALTEINGLTEGTYVFTLKVTDNRGGTNEDEITITVNPATAPPPANIAPVATAGPDKTITLPENSVSLTASGSSDSDGEIVAWTWSYVSGPTGSQITNIYGETTDINSLTEGTYRFRLVVRDNGGTTDSDTITIKVNPEVVVPPVDPPPADNKIPVADAGVDMLIILPDPGIRLNGLNSYDPDGTIMSYSWTQISGAGGITITNDNTTTPGVLGAKEGEYVFRLTVTDDRGATSYDDMLLTIKGEIKTDTSAQKPTDTIPDENLKYEEKISVYPNPVLSSMNVKYTSEHNGKVRVSIYNMNGMIVHSNTADKNQIMYQQNINVSHLQRGIYYVEIVVDGHRKVTKFVKK